MNSLKVSPLYILIPVAICVVFIIFTCTSCIVRHVYTLRAQQNTDRPHLTRGYDIPDQSPGENSMDKTSSSFVYDKGGYLSPREVINNNQDYEIIT